MPHILQHPAHTARRPGQHWGVFLAICLPLIGAGLMTPAVADGPLTQEWAATFRGFNAGGSTPPIDQVTGMVLDQAGNVYVTGYSYQFVVTQSSTTPYDYITVKFDGATGRQLWLARHDGLAHKDDRATGIANDTLGNVYVTGYSTGSDGYTDYVTAKYDGATGQQLWEAHYDGPGHKDDRPAGVRVDQAGNVYVTGSTQESDGSSDSATLKYDGATGQELWSALHPGASAALVVDAAGNVCVTGANYQTIKYAGSTGQELWSNLYSGAGNQATAMTLDPAGNVCVTGTSGNPSYGSEYATVKFDGATGQQLWAARYAGDHAGGSATAIGTDPAGNVCVTGYAVFFGEGQDYATVKYAAQTGQQQWVAHYASPHSSFDAFRDDHASALTLDAAGNVYVTGYSYNTSSAGNTRDFLTQKYEGRTGETLSSARYDGFFRNSDVAVAVALDPAGNILVAGNADGTPYDASSFGGWYTVVRYRQEIPTLTDLAVSNVTQTGATLTWNTNLPANSRVEYGPTGYTTAKLDNAYVTSHSITLTGLTPGTTYVFRVFSTLVDGTLFGPVLGSFTTDPGFSISGKVTVAGVGVSPAFILAGGQIISTAADGTYTVANLPTGSYVVSAFFTGYSFPTQAVQVGPSQTGVDFDARANISGRVMGAGALLGGAVISCAGLSTTSAGDGTYTLINVPLGTRVVQCAKAGYSFTDQTVVVGPNKTGVNFDSLASISGKVTVGGDGLGGALVAGAGKVVFTADDGTYSLTGVKAGRYLVMCTAIGYTFSNQVVQVGPSRTDVDFSAPFNPALVGPFTISGKVSAGGVALGGALVSGAGQTVTTADDGTYALTNVGTGNYGIIATAPGYSFSQRNVLVGPSKSGVDFDALLTISGRVTVAGAGLGGARVTGGGRSATTAADGTYTLTGVAGGSYLVHASATGYTFTDRLVQLGPNQTGVDFDAPATISGKVTTAGAPLTGAVVSGGGQTATTTADGSYTLTGLGAGSYVVHVSYPGYIFTDQTVVVGPSKTNIDFNAPATISGTVRVGGAGLGGALVSGVGQTVVTAPDGTYALTVTAKGNYLVQCHAIGYTFPDRTAQVGPSQTGVDFDAPFDPALTGPFTISGRVTVGGVGLGGVVVAGGSDVTITAADGSYTLTGFTAGNYGIIASAPGLSFPVQNVSVGPNQTGVDFALP